MRCQLKLQYKKMARVIFIGIFLLIATIAMITGFDHIHDKRDDYIDPFDMLNYDSTTKNYRENKYQQESNVKKGKDDLPEVKEDVPSPPTQPVDKNADVEQPEQKSGVPTSGSCDAVCKPCEQTECLEDDYMKQYLRTLLTNFKADSLRFDVPTSFQMTMTVNKDDIAVLKRYTSTDVGSIQDVSDVLGRMVKQVTTLEEEYQEPLFNIEQIISHQQIGSVLQILAAACLFVVILYLGCQLHFSWKQLTVRLVIICFIISVPWNWLHLYKKAAAKKTSEAIKGIPDECRPSDTSWLSAAKSWYRATFTFLENKCDKYHEAMEVDPFWEVSPLQAIAVSLSTFVFEPAGHFGDAISKFFRGLLQHVPIQWALPLFLTVIVIFLFILFMMFGYRIKIPFIAAIEPAERITSEREKELLNRIHMLEDTNRSLHEKIPSLQPGQALKVDNIGISRQAITHSSELSIWRSHSCECLTSTKSGGHSHSGRIERTGDVSGEGDKPRALGRPMEEVTDGGGDSFLVESKKKDVEVCGGNISGKIVTDIDSADVGSGARKLSEEVSHDLGI